MSQFDVETAAEPAGEGRWATHLSAGWNIADNSNGGYALTSVLRAMRSLVSHPDPISVTTHFLRPARGDTDGDVRAEVVRSGRTVSTLRGSLWQEGKQRLEVLAAFSDLSTGSRGGPEIAEAPPTIPPIEDCVHRGSLEQGVELPILSRVDVHVHPEHAPAGGSDRALIDGWIRFSDGAEPSTMALPFFADALPPSLYPLLGFIGWVPTIELTVHARRTPAPGWLQVRQESHDLHNGRMIESGSLWDSTGALVATSRQIGLLLT
ncbi:MAG: thioesterase family protein [Acidimicrobiaceae bacterium]|nr:thioesterase family protein [Acidimicrobiaceae bacterium]